MMTAYKIAKRSAGTGVVALLGALTLRFGFVFMLRLGVVAVLVLGGASLAGTLVERVWSATRRTAARLGIPFPRAAAAVTTLAGVLALVLAAQALSGVHGYHVTIVLLSSGFLLVGGCITGERWLSGLWNTAARLFRKAFPEGVQSNG